MIRKLCLAAVCVLLLSPMAIGSEPPSLPELIATIRAGDETARIQAIDHIGLMNQQASDAVPALTQLLEDPSTAIRAHAAGALGRVGAAAKPAASALVSLVADPDQAVRRSAVEALKSIRPGPQVTIPLFVKLMKDADPGTRMRALHAMADAGKEAVPGLVEALKDKEAAHWACLVLNQIGPAAAEAVPQLIQLVQDAPPQTRLEAILALAEIGEVAAPAVPTLVKRLDDDLDRTAATYALGRIGKMPPEAEVKIRGNMNSPDSLLGSVSIWTMARLHPEDKALVRQATELLAERLKSDDPRARTAAARALASLQPGPEISGPIMEKAFANADEETVRAALDALAGLGPVAVPRLIEALKYESVRLRAVYILGQIGPEAAPAADALARLIDDKNPEVQKEAVIALAKIGPGAKAAVPTLATALQEHEAPVLYGIVYALGKIGPASAEAQPALQNLLGNEDDALSLLSAWALAQIGPESPETAAKVVPLLIGGLAHADANHRREAAGALEKLGPRAKAALPALNAARNDEDQAVREAVAQALKAIGG